MIINNNIPALNTHRQMGINQGNMQSSMEKLSSGMRINKAGDDAAGLAISEKMRAQINGLDQASRNAQDGISMIQTAEGALDETHSILQRMRELSVQSANDTNVAVDRDEIQKEVDQLSSEITRIADNTEFNTQNLLGGEFEGKFQIGANTDQNISLSINAMGSDALDVVKAATSAEVSSSSEELFLEGYDATDITGTDGSFDISIDGNAATSITVDSSITSKEDLVDAINTGISGEGTATLNDDGTISIVSDTTGETSSVQVDNITEGDDGTDDVTNLAALFDNNSEVTGTDRDTEKGIDISTQASANAAIETINTAIETVSAERSMLGATQNRLEHTISNLDNASENLSAAESRIRDVDMAAEMMEMTKSNILSQASQSMLAQANQQPQSVLQLLG